MIRLRDKFGDSDRYNFFRNCRNGFSKVELFFSNGLWEMPEFFIVFSDFSVFDQHIIYIIHGVRFTFFICPGFGIPECYPVIVLIGIIYNEFPFNPPPDLLVYSFTLTYRSMFSLSTLIFSTFSMPV